MNCPDNPAGYARASAPQAGVPEPTASGEQTLSTLRQRLPIATGGRRPGMNP